MGKSYIEQRESGYWITGTRISLDSIVYAFKRGAAPESIQRAFPLLTLEEIYGAITFYLAHEQEIDIYLAQADPEFTAQASALNAAARTANPTLFKRLEQARTPARRLANESLLPGWRQLQRKDHSRSTTAGTKYRFPNGRRW
jgi:uncharacterized protein (DUF433 family)